MTEDFTFAVEWVFALCEDYLAQEEENKDTYLYHAYQIIKGQSEELAVNILKLLQGMTQEKLDYWKAHRSKLEKLTEHL